MPMIRTQDGTVIKISRPKRRPIRASRPAIRTQSEIVQRIAKANADANENGWNNPTGRKRPLYEVLPDGAWRGSRAFVIGGGPSLRGFDFDRLRGEKIIAINRAFEFAPFADILYSMDNRLYRWFTQGTLGPKTKTAFSEFKGRKVWLDLMNFPYHGVFYIRGLKVDLEQQGIKAGIYHGNNSGFGALMLAAALRANPIYLLGYDMKHAAGTTHFYPAYPVRQTASTVKGFMPYFMRTAPRLKARGIQIINLNPDSALRCFPFDSIDNVLNGRKPDDHNLKNQDAPATQAAGGPGAAELAADRPGRDLPERQQPDVSEAGPVLD